MNGHHATRALKPGVNVPIVTIFKPETEDLDLEAIAKHVVRLAEAGLTSITCQGSNGEAVHLTKQERIQVVQTTRKALDDAGFPDFPIVVGCGAQSVRETVEFCKDAYSAGGDYALVLPPSYYKSSFTQASFVEYFQDVATESPIPILIYNYPGAAGGVDLDSDTIIKLAKHPKIVGCKLTCGNTGKLNRIANAVNAATPTSTGSGWLCLGGSADFTLQTLIAGGSGIITGLGNVVPKACVKVFNLYAEGKVEDAQKLQAIVARGDWGVISGGIPGTKSALQSYFGYGGYARRPLPKPSREDVARHEAVLKEVVELEKTL
ncbi:hypothetical protein A1O3_09326 [Capronia epimyces CBS 606.96]|uniref:4-hydroxy-2-oxoglutarate aldolase, mitochondrial n=1 Tax=Capronia epimyces CBS 606.96 TaxID=1182542 RepID=W9XLF5_9EURO|nr:uncharacterized protein A1O3_09326 [Capronia epimyces CBS 606.96]EXJ78165.1 hypothetical protein A1O3_09326 [Capronia epimyces CBS 606.96]